MSKVVLIISFIFFSLPLDSKIGPFVITNHLVESKPGEPKSTSLIIPQNFHFSVYNYCLDWNYNETFQANDQNISGDFSYDYGQNGTYQFAIMHEVSDGFPAIYFNNGRGGGAGNEEALKLLSIDQRGENGWPIMENAFYGYESINPKSTDVQNLKVVKNSCCCFVRCIDLTDNLSIKLLNRISDIYLSRMIEFAQLFIQNIGCWGIDGPANLQKTLTGCEMLPQNNDSTLIDGGTKNVESDVSWEAGDFELCESEAPYFYDQTEIICGLDTLNGYCLDMRPPLPAAATSWPGCPTVSFNNPSWFTFVAGAEDLSIQVFISDCDSNMGVQTALYELDCEIDFDPNNPDGTQPTADQLVSPCSYVTAPTQGSVIFTTTTDPGQVYGIIVDGWNGDQCNVVVEQVLIGSDPPELDGTDLIAPSFVDGGFGFLEDTICAGAEDVPFTLEGEVEGACSYRWTLDGVDIEDGTNSTEEFISFPEPGTYEVCVYASNLCNETDPVCLEVVVAPLDPYITFDTICEGDDYIWEDPFGGTLTPEPPVNPNIPGTFQYTSTAFNQYDCTVPAELNLFIRNENDENPTMIDTFACFDDVASGNFSFYCEVLTEPGTYDQECISPFTGCDTFFTIDLVVFGGPFNIAPACTGNREIGFYFQDPEGGKYTPWDEQFLLIGNDTDYTIEFKWTETENDNILGVTRDLFLNQDTIEKYQNGNILNLQLEVTIFYRGTYVCKSRADYQFLITSIDILGDTSYCVGKSELKFYANVRSTVFPDPNGGVDSTFLLNWNLPQGFNFVPPSTMNSDTITISASDTLMSSTLCLTVFSEGCLYSNTECIDLSQKTPNIPEPELNFLDTFICLGEVLNMEVLNAEVYAEINWNFNNSQNTGPSLSIEDLDSVGVYNGFLNLTYENEINCIIVDTFTVGVNADFDYQIEAIDTCNESIFQIDNLIPNASYSWISEGDLNILGPTTGRQVRTDGRGTLTSTVNNGCEVIKQRLVDTENTSITELTSENSRDIVQRQCNGSVLYVFAEDHCGLRWGYDDMELEQTVFPLKVDGELYEKQYLEVAEEDFNNRIYFVEVTQCGVGCSTEIIVFRSSPEEMSGCEEDKNQLVVYPNPTFSIANVYMENWSEGRYDLKIFNSVGNKVVQEKFSIGRDGNTEVQLRLEKLVPGYYTLNIFQAGEWKASKSLIKIDY